ncbi:MAG: patatin-like phospholipase family protein [Pyrinomonadaceae bacterium]
MSDLPTTENSSFNPLVEKIDAACQPVHYLDIDEGKNPEEGTALCLSGGGYRAMLFHAGVLWRLNEIGWLAKLSRISSVSGGSITAGVLAMNWNKLAFQNGIGVRFNDEIITPLRNLASHTIDVYSVLKGTFWFGTIGDKIASYYRKYLFGSTNLQDITDNPRFVFNATNVQSGVLWRFMKPYMRDYRVGEVKNPRIDLAIVVAASSAFPPILSPVELRLDPNDFTADSATDLPCDEYKKKVILVDGGVYDNLGLETAWKRYKTILVSDAGLGFKAKSRLRGNWASQAVRVLFTIDNQVRSLRRRQLIEAYKSKIRTGAFWSIESHAAKSPLSCPVNKTSDLANIATALRKLDNGTQERLINWGYASCDLGLRRHFVRELPIPNGFPFPETGV